jgi:hypothetical protein
MSQMWVLAANQSLQATRQSVRLSLALAVKEISMRVEVRRTFSKKGRSILRGLILLTESEEESELIDAVFGKKVGKNGLIGIRSAEARLSDGYGDHYVYISANKSLNPTREGTGGLA